jgi:hypothetical protein
MPGWAWDDVLPAHRRLETEHDFGTDAWHGTEGPMPIFRIPQERWGAVDRALCEAALAAGYGWCADHNAPTGEGVSPYAINGDPVREERVTTNDAYLEPARDRPNLEVRGDMLVDRVLFDGGRVTGALLADGTTLIAPVVVSAGLCTRRRSSCAPGSGRGCRSTFRSASTCRTILSSTPWCHCAPRRSRRRPSTVTRTCACATRQGSPARDATT